MVQLTHYLGVVSRQYTKIIGILTNHREVRLLKWTKNGEGWDKVEIPDTPQTLQDKTYYFDLFKETRIDTNLIYTKTARINDLLHHNIGIKDLNQRMIFTACALVAVQLGEILREEDSYEVMKVKIRGKIERVLRESTGRYNEKLSVLLEVYDVIHPAMAFSQIHISEFISYVNEIAGLIDSKYWRGEDVMGIFFNEFSRF